MEIQLVDPDFRAEAESALAWLARYRRSIECRVDRIPFHKSDEWEFEEATSTLRHSTGRFFTIQGYRGDLGERAPVFQPLINQPETGTQGFIIRRTRTELELLVQARTEPGNIGLVQIGPTIQATYSNYTAVHNGRQQPFLELFHHPEKFGARLLVDTIQPELGSKFLRKWNRNIVIESNRFEDFSDPMFRWVSLKTLTGLMRLDHIVNNDARLVVGLLALECGAGLFEGLQTELSHTVSESFESESSRTFESVGEASGWLAQIRSRQILNVQDVPLNELPGWIISDDEIRHQDGLYFSAIQVRVHAADREVSDWDQPLLASHQKGEITLVCQEFEGALNFLLCVEPQLGNANGAELQPTYCFDNEEPQETPQSIAELLKDDRLVNRFAVDASDEGGRFYQCVSRYEIRQLHPSVKADLPENYAWLTLGQIRSLLHGTDAVSDESRSILSLFLSATISGQLQRKSAEAA